MALQIIFILVSLFTLLTAWIVVTNRNLFHAALAMMGSFLGVAIIYALLDAGFLAAAQLLVYVGAIAILVIFAIMMTRRLMQTTENPFNANWVGAGVASLAAYAIIVLVHLQWRSAFQPGAGLNAGAPPVDPAVLRSSVEVMGTALVDPNAYVIPFEVASILLLAALVGAIFIARPDVATGVETEEFAERHAGTDDDVAMEVIAGADTDIDTGIVPEVPPETPLEREEE